MFWSLHREGCHHWFWRYWPQWLSNWDDAGILCWGCWHQLNSSSTSSQRHSKPTYTSTCLQQSIFWICEDIAVPGAIADLGPCICSAVLWQKKQVHWIRKLNMSCGHSFSASIIKVYIKSSLRGNKVAAVLFLFLFPFFWVSFKSILLSQLSCRD